MEFNIFHKKSFADLGRLSYDFYLPDYNAFIECDGRQHFEEVLGYFHHTKSLKHQQDRDIRKNKYAMENDYCLLRIGHTIENVGAPVKEFLSIAKRYLNKYPKVIMFSPETLYKGTPHFDGLIDADGQTN